MHHLLVEGEEAGQGFPDEGASDPLFLCVLGNRYVQHAGVILKKELALHYHTYVIPKGCNLKDAVVFWYGCSFDHCKGLAGGFPEINGDAVDKQVKNMLKW